MFFIDFGNSEIVSVRDLRKYGPKLLKAIGKIAAQAFPCILTKIRPSQRKNPGGQWCESAKKKFYEIVKKGELIGSIYSVVNGTISLVLYKIIQQGSKQLEYNINQILVNEGFAEVCEESYLSKVRHKIYRLFYCLNLGKWQI